MNFKDVQCLYVLIRTGRNEFVEFLLEVHTATHKCRTINGPNKGKHHIGI